MKVCLLCEGMSATERTSCASCGRPLVAEHAVHFPIRRGEEDATNPLLGALIDGKYRITGVLGRGGMGTVYRAMHQISMVPVALKILHPRFATRPEHRDQFLAEARKAGRVAHEHVARILDVGEAEDGTVYLAIELVEGATLHEWIHAGEEPLEPAITVTILQQICLALSAAHGAGLVHRDLTPRNVMVLVRDRRPFVKILDFGIARFAASGTEPDGGDPLAGFANPPYSAPEHLEGRETDARADLYSLGVIAYEALGRRLPVTGNTRRELAQGTIEGRLVPLRLPAGTPSRLARLIERLLARDPAQRPASAADVRRELDAMLAPPSGVLRTFAVVTFVIALAGWLIAAGDTTAPWLEPEPGTSLALHARFTPEVKSQELTLAQLEQVRLRFVGFDGRRLRVELIQGDAVPPIAEDLAPEVDEASGVLTLRGTSLRYAGFLRTLAALSRDRPVDLRFLARGQPVGCARVQIDDDAPQVELQVAPSPRDELFGQRELTIDVTDRGTLDLVALLVTVAGDARSMRRIPLGPLASPTVTAVELLGAAFPGVRPTEGPIQLSVEAVDRARNRGVSRTLDFGRVDLRVPRIERVHGGRDATIRHGPEGARLYLDLDAAEPDLVVAVTPPGGKTEELVPVAPVATNRLELRLPRPATAPDPFPKGVYSFELRDRAGNHSDALPVLLEFFTEELDASLAVRTEGSSGAEAAVHDDLVLVAGEHARLEFRCNSLYTPLGAVARTRTDRRGVGDVRVVAAAAGSCGLELERLPPGIHELVVEVAERPVDQARTASWTLHVLHGPMRLSLPATLSHRFVPGLARAGLVAEDAGRVVQGPAWLLQPDEARLLRGRVWHGIAGTLAPHPLALDRGGGSFLPVLPLLPGENVIAVELQDLLGRPVEVRIGDTEARRLQPLPGVEARELLRFHWHAGLPEPVEPVVRVEHEQPARLQLRVPLPFTAEDEIHLRVDARAIAPERVVATREGCVLQFALPFAQLAVASGFTQLRPEDFANEREAILTVNLETPARDYRGIGITLRTIRSTLRPLVLGDLPLVERAADPALRAIELVPVLGPPGGEIVRDPVAEHPHRSSFRPQPALSIRGLESFYLQRGELTRAQYLAALRSLDTLTAAERDRWRELVHDADPLGARRLEKQHLLPATGSDGAFARAVDLGADRPVTGVSFFQAWTVARAIGRAVAGDPELVRLPLGVELDWAALGAEIQPQRWNGCSRTASPVRLGDLRAAAGRVGDPAHWPPTAAESGRLGDQVPGVQPGAELLALDFGVREWVLDLPYLAGMEAQAVLREWLAVHPNHLERALALGRGVVPPGDLGRTLGTTGVVRGVASGERASLEDADGVPFTAGDATAVPPLLPGVVRTLYLRRDGRGLLASELDPHLASTGFRLAGGAGFVAKARAR